MGVARHEFVFLKVGTYGECCCFCKEKEAWETDLSQTLLPPFLLLVYDHGTDVYGKNARDKTLE